MIKNIVTKALLSLILISIFFMSGCACNRSWQEGYLKGAVTGLVAGGAAGYALSDDPNDDTKYIALGAAFGNVIGGLIGANINRCDQVVMAEEVKEIDSDGDGLADSLDQCPDTPAGVKVDFKGCPVDTDKDGIADYLDKCPGTPDGIKVDSKGCPYDTDGDGVYDYLDKCPETPGGVAVNSDGCPLDTDRDGISDYLDKCPGTPEGAKVDDRGCWVLGELYFDFGKASIKSESYQELDEVVDILKENPDIKLEIQGHTDSKGSAQYNQTLSEKRAKSVEEYFISHGVKGSQLSYKGYGEEFPIASNETEEGRARNRRVELKPVP